MAWLYPPSHRFLHKPQAILWPEVTPDTGSDADTSIASIEAIDGDVSYDSTSGDIASYHRDVFLQRGRQEIDLVVNKVLKNEEQVTLLIIELKRDNETIADALRQIGTYVKRISLNRNSAIDANLDLHALLILGKASIRFECRPGTEGVIMHCPDSKVDEAPIPIKTDSQTINKWCSDQAVAWALKDSI